MRITIADKKDHQPVVGEYSSPATHEAHLAAVRKDATARREKRILSGTLIISDAAMIFIAVTLAWYVRIGSGLIAYYGHAVPADYLFIIPVAVVILLPIFALNRLYHYHTLLGGSQEYAAVFRACSYGMIVLVFASFLQRTEPLSRGWLLASWIMTNVLVGVSRFAWRRFFQWLRRKHGWLVTRTLIVGANDEARAIAHQMAAQSTGVDIVGFVDDYLPLGTPVIDGRLVLGPPTRLHELAEANGIEQVIVLPDAVAWETFQDVMRQSVFRNGFEIQLSPGFYGILTTSVRVTQNGFVPLLEVDQARVTGLDLVMKMSLDYGLGAVLTVLASPFMAALALAIWLTDGSPVLEYIPVLGLHGTAFKTHRFRTRARSAVGTTAMSGNFPLGSFLYRTGLDKLPQLFDVLRGHLSLVGPRPISADSTQNNQRWSSSLFTVKPGMTGPWAVEKSASQREEQLLDLYYIRNWTIWLDLQVLYQAARMSLTARSRKAR